MSELVLGAGIEAGDTAALDAYVARLELDPESDASFRANLPRLLVYRTLVRARLREAIELAVPRSLARLGPLFDEYFERFLAERGPSTHYLRDVTNEWLDYSVPRWNEDARVPSYLGDLARHEALEIVVASGADRAPADGALPPRLECGLDFIEAACVVRYEFRVHELSEDLEDRRVPTAAPTALFVYRSPEHEVRYLELTPLAASILERLLAGDTLGQAVKEASARAAVPLDSSVLDGTARLLAELAERGALLGPSLLNTLEKGSTMAALPKVQEDP